MQSVKTYNIKRPTSHSRGVGSVVMKGFTVPTGYVLHYKTGLGAEVSARSGEFVKTSYTFSDVYTGDIPGWSLQKLQSETSFSVEPDEVFEDHTFTPWGEKSTVLGVSLLPAFIIKKMNAVNNRGGWVQRTKYPEVSTYVADISVFLEKTYGYFSKTPEDTIQTINTVNSNINLLLSMENSPVVKDLYSVESPPDVTNPKLQDILTNPPKIKLESLSPKLLEDIVNHFGISGEDFLEYAAGVPDTFLDRYGEYIRLNSVKVDNKLVSKSEAEEYIKQSIQSIPQELRPVVLSHLFQSDLSTKTIDEAIQELKNSDYFFQEEISLEDFESIDSKDEITLYDLRKRAVVGMDYIVGRFEILKKLLSMQSLIKLREQEESSQSVRDCVSEIIENYIEYLGGDPDVYRELCISWVSGKESKIVSRFKDWGEGKSVKEYADTFFAVQSAHSSLAEKFPEFFRPVEYDFTGDISRLSIKAGSLVSFSLNEELCRKQSNKLLRSSNSSKHVVLIPGFYMPKSYWKHISGKRVFLNRPKVSLDENFEVVLKAKDILIKDFHDDIIEVAV